VKIKDYFRGTLPAGHGGGCGNCGHKAVKSGCACAAEWCPCHRAAKGHGAHGCDCRARATARLKNIKKVSK
jgi:hypothetical protein